MNANRDIIKNAQHSQKASWLDARDDLSLKPATMGTLRVISPSPSEDMLPSERLKAALGLFMGRY